MSGTGFGTRVDVEAGIVPEIVGQFPVEAGQVAKRHVLVVVHEIFLNGPGSLLAGTF